MAGEAFQSEPLLSVEGLTTSFKLRHGEFAAIREISFTLAANETLALVGESGCGKSLTALSIMRLLPEPQGRITDGRVMFEGRNLADLDDRTMEKLRGNRLAMIFQEPMTSLNPVLPIGLQIAEPLMFHQELGEGAAKARAVELLRLVGIPAAEDRVLDYPHQFSGGMRQRVMIAMALACRPALLLADEPTTALDVTIQAQVLALLAELKTEYGMAMIFISHNLGVVATIADRIAVMYAGEIVELASTDDLFARPTHPYTEALLRSIPRPDRDVPAIPPIAGTVPAIDAMPQGCRFAARCPLKERRCETAVPPLVGLAGEGAHLARCWVRTDAEIEAAV
ncbi:MAG: ABC transporter ATP-binding protein [Pseudomonadota bacterium]